ncbi:3-hydroxyacyl-ACP dehydratase [Enterovibrio paralichthyis]|uniref:ApeI family dehydratase n=1 Tax=Enterovibrio paralichthyis TaxID=2853805 RepID=UPI001C48D97A|nr:3-hydroxyacyl-ACP dehydratase [Enterovibrio paralichthyis]MBV7297786.1 3-hydroxyacyl-ACP dehydratase [Enterovibrio paralichthyis]
MRTPTLLQEEASPSGTTLTVRMDAQLDVFKGHFPDFPLLPGVAQIDFAVRYARQYLAVDGEFVGMDAIKFQDPILPGSTVTLTLEWAPEKEKLGFSFRSGNRAHSSGRILLKQSA